MQPAESRQRFFAQLKESISSSLAGDDARRLDDFSRLYFENALFDELKDRRPRDIYGAIFGTWSFYGLSVVALFRLRAREPNLPRPFRATGYPVVPALFLALSVFLSVSIVIERPVRSLIGIGLILAGIPFYLFWNRRRPGG